MYYKLGYVLHAMMNAGMKNTFAKAHLLEYHYSELDLIIALSKRTYFYYTLLCSVHEGM